MKNNIEELRAMAQELLSNDTIGEQERKKLGDNVFGLLQELSVYHFELEHQNASLAVSEQELALSKAMYVDLFEEAPVGYVIINRAGIIQQVNKTFIDRYVSCLPNERVVNGRAFVTFVSEEYRNAYENFLHMLPSSASILPVELRLLDAFKKPRYATITAGKRQSGDQTFRLTINDIDNRKKLENQLLTAKEFAEENDRKKTMFLTDISQELRTPLETMTGFYEMLEETELTTERRKAYLEALRNATLSLRMIADAVVDVSQLDSGKMPLRNGSVDIAKICAEQLSLLRHYEVGKNVSVTDTIESIPRLNGDSARMGIVIHSLLKYMMTNAPAGHIALRGKYVRNETDSGTLILEFAENQFNPDYGMFSNAEVAEAFQKRDTVRLLLVRRILKAMNGRMEFDRTLRHIHVEIPMTMVPEVDKTAVPNTPEFSGAGSKKCLLVDDVPMNLRVLAALMRKLNCIPVTAASGKEALELLVRNPVDYVLTDLWMPEMNGMELAMTIRQMPEYDAIPIIAVTADVERAENFDMHYFADTLIKPVNLATLKETLSDLQNQ